MLLTIPLGLVVTGCLSASINYTCNLTISTIKAVVLHGENCAYPGLVRLPNNALLAAYSCGSIKTSISYDNGATWTSLGSVDFPNASVLSLSLLPDGDIFLSTSYNPSSGIGVPAYVLGQISSKDGSISWGNPILVNTPNWANGCWAVSPLINLGSNRLLWPVWCYSNSSSSEYGSSTVLVSTDGGKTWNTQITVANGDKDGRDYDESAGVVYGDGEVVMIMRHTNPGSTDIYGSWWYTHSLDSGNTWSSPKKVADSTYVGRPSVVLLNNGSLLLVGRARTLPNSSTGYAVSRDRGLSFSQFNDLGFDVVDTFDVYSALTLLSDGSVGVVTTHSNSGGKTTNIDYRNLRDECGLSSD